MKRTNLILILVMLATTIFAQNPDKTWWTFTYPSHPATDSCLLNLRYLNEDYAGQHGFIQLSDDGNSFVQGNRKPVRFWRAMAATWQTK